ncbi:MAG: hypothetical protein M3P29_00860, partial [Acidobacteriota bacterium]|nr:hypothetical protein [Acidobacteriota bacterium]
MEKPSLVGGSLEALDACLQLCEIFFEGAMTFFEDAMLILDGAYPTVELSMRKLNHRLRISESNPHFGADVGSLTVELFVEKCDLLSEEPAFVSGRFRRDTEVAAHFCRSLLKLLPHLCRNAFRGLVEVALALGYA